jgi:hypothetical protein
MVGTDSCVFTSRLYTLQVITAPSDSEEPALSMEASLPVVHAVAAAWAAGGHNIADLVRLALQLSVQLPVERRQSVLTELLKPLPEVAPLRHGLFAWSRVMS